MIYLSPYIGLGTLHNAFRPLGSDDPGWSGIDLRKDPTGVLGVALISLPNALNDPRLLSLAADSKEVLTSLTKTRVELLVGFSVQSATTLASLAELFLYTDNSAKICKPVQWSAQGTREIYLGGGMISREERNVPPGAAGDPVDFFTRANENPLAGNWTKVTNSSQTFQLLTNEVKGAGTDGDTAYYWNADTPANDQWSQAAMGTAMSTNGDGGLCCRVSTSAFSMYMASTYNAAKALYQITAGSFTSIAGITTSNFASGDTCRIDAQGSTIRFKKNGTEQTGSPVTDTTFTAGRWGMFIYEPAQTLDSWQGGDFNQPWSWVPRFCPILAQ